MAAVKKTKKVGHAPGPWIDDFENSGAILNKHGDILRIYVDNHPGGNDFETGKKTAAVITAAPEMLKVIERLANISDLTQLNSLVRKARKILIKASYYA